MSEVSLNLIKTLEKHPIMTYWYLKESQCTSSEVLCQHYSAQGLRRAHFVRNEVFQQFLMYEASVKLASSQSDLEKLCRIMLVLNSTIHRY